LHPVFSIPVFFRPHMTSSAQAPGHDKDINELSLNHEGVPEN